MASASVFKVVNLAFASMIFIQSLVYGLLSILAILCTYGFLKFNNGNLDTLPKGITTGIYELYLAGDMAVPDSSRVFPKEFFIYIFWPFSIFSIFLAFASLTHIIILAQNSKRRKVNASTIINLILVFASCLYDVLATVIFAMDYVKIRDFTNEEFLLSTPIFMMSLAAKGYVLLFINFIMAVCISVMLRTKNRQDSDLEPDEHIFSRTNSAYDAFGDAVLSDGTEMPNERRKTQFHRRETVVNPYAQTILDDGRMVLDDGHMGLDNRQAVLDDEGMVLDNGQMVFDDRQLVLNDGYATTNSLDRIPQKIQEYLEPFDSIAPQSISDFEPQQQRSLHLNTVEPDPDYSPHPDYSPELTRRMGMNMDDFFHEEEQIEKIMILTPLGSRKYF